MAAKPTPVPTVSIIVNHGTPTQRVFATVPAAKIEDFGARQVAAAFAHRFTVTVHYFGPWIPGEFKSNTDIPLTQLDKSNFIPEAIA